MVSHPFVLVRWLSSLAYPVGTLGKSTASSSLHPHPDVALTPTITTPQSLPFTALAFYGKKVYDFRA